MDRHSLVAQWLLYAEANKVRAITRYQSGDHFGAELALARGEVRKAAAYLLRSASEPMEAARQMHREAAARWLRDLPIVGFDKAALDYTRARAWQDCARTIDPSLPVVQPEFEREE